MGEERDLWLQKYSERLGPPGKDLACYNRKTTGLASSVVRDGGVVSIDDAGGNGFSILRRYIRDRRALADHGGYIGCDKKYSDSAEGNLI